MKVAPGDAAAFDIALDHLVPGEVRIGHAAVAEDPDMDDELDARVRGGIHDRLALMDHVNRVPGRQEETIHLPERLRERPGIIEIQINGILPVPPPGFDLLMIARGMDGPMSTRHSLQFGDQCLAGAPG